MLRDGNRPEGFYGEVYDRNEHMRKMNGVINEIDRPYSTSTWKTPDALELLKKINTDLQ